MITVTAQEKRRNRLWQVCLSEHFWLCFILMHKRSQQKQVCKTKHPSGIYSPGFLSNTLSSSIRGKKISSVIWVFCAKEKKCMWHNSRTSCYWTILCYSRVCVGLLWQSCKHYFSHLCTQHTHMHHPHAARLFAAIASNISWIADDEHGCTEICSFYIFA